MVVTREGEGHSKPSGDDELPIDIHYKQLNDWLVDRKKVSGDWRKKLAAVHAKTAELARQLPSSLVRAGGLGVPDAASLAGGTDGGEASKWDYFRAVVVRDRILEGAPATTTTGGGGGDGGEGDGDGGDGGGGGGGEDAQQQQQQQQQPTRGLFGRLAGKAKEWDDVVRSYERDFLQLPEAGLTLMQGTDYDVPHHRAQAAKRTKQLQDLDRKEAEYKRGAAAAREKFIAACDEVGVPAAASRVAGGAGFAPELDRVVGGLDAVFEAAASAARSPAVGEAATHYAQWIAFAHKREHTVEELLPNLSELRAYEEGATVNVDGDGTSSVAAAAAAAAAAGMMEGFSIGGDAGGVGDGGGGFSIGGDAGGPPGIVEPPAGGIDWGIGGGDDDDDAAASAPGIVEPPTGGIDWDLGGALSAEDGGDGAAAGVVDIPAGGIDWDLGAAADVDAADADVDAAAAGVEAGGIDWGIDMSCVTAEGSGADDASAGGGVVEINWDIGDVTVEDSGGGFSIGGDGGGDVGFSIGGDAGSGGGGEAAAAGDAARRGRPFHARLERQDFRAAVVDELLELRSFLKQRASDLRSKEATSLLSSAPSSVQSYVAPDALLSLADAVHAPVGVLRDDAARRLLLISTSKRYRERLVADLEAKAALEGKLLGALRELDEKRAETRLSHKQSMARGDALCKALREVKGAVEDIISKQYKGRATNVIGEINNVLG